jgi:CheY-like chemotaxis protein
MFEVDNDGDYAARVLVVDDSEECRGRFSSALLAAGYEVRLATGGSDAINQMLRSRFDVMLLAEDLQGLSGLNLLRQLVCLPFSHLPRVIVVPDRGTSEMAEQAIHLGAVAYIPKDCVEQWLEAIAQAIAPPTQRYFIPPMPFQRFA